MSTQTINLTPELYHYMQAVSLRENETQLQLREQTQQLAQSQMQISPEQGQFMALLIKLMHAKKTLDIGTFTGYSALAVALALPAEGKVIACDVSKEWTNIAKASWRQAGVSAKIDLHIGPASQTLQRLIDDGQSNSFDFAFIDADKTGYDDYYEKSLKLIRQGGLIMFDNVFRNGAVTHPQASDQSTQAICALNKKLHQDERVYISMVPMSDGLTLAYKL